MGAPEHDREAARARAVHLAPARALPSGRRPRQPVGTKNEQRDRVQTQPVHERSRLAIEEPRQRAAAQRYRLIAAEWQHRRKLETALEPVPATMAVAALDLERPPRMHEGQVAPDRLADHRGAGGP